MGIFKVIRNTNDELQYLYNVLNYTMGIHTDYDKRYSPNVDIYNAYEQFLSVKKYFGKVSGNPAFHFIVVYNASSTWGDNYERAESMSQSIASYFADKYQIVYAIHRKPCSKKYGSCSSVYHAHFVMNSVSYMDGKMFSGNRAELYAFLTHIKRITRDDSWVTQYGSEKKNRYPDSSDAMAV
ncbi:relaxase/mobilization nuclease domain-containing protein [Ruminococcus sp.]|uniref:relaxase/mobilization nuclease domain-containing protein n=1 Tax=Ruminococcus sp. TaxID=41978 RepID=UPI0025D3AFC7|nr:relaxase/mobilization nuclease domain-containing protein [Ruminococcus sp.]